MLHKYWKKKKGNNKLVNRFLQINNNLTLRTK